MSPEQRQALREQTKFLTETAFPAYKQIIGQAGGVYEDVAPKVGEAATGAGNVAGRVGAELERQGAGAYGTGLSGLKALFDPNYKAQQVEAAMQKGREEARESQLGQNAMYGAAGGLGGARMALADKNMADLNAQRQATAAAAARAGVQANKATVANQLATLGQTQLGAAQTSAGARIAYAQTPQDVLAKYASVIYGTPQASTTPNFAGTQGQKTSSKGFGF
jgi:hypothetical protein